MAVQNLQRNLTKYYQLSKTELWTISAVNFH